MEKHQVGLYVAALGVGAVLGLGLPALGLPSVAPLAATLVEPFLALLLFSTFLAVPLARIPESIRSPRFLLAAIGVNVLLVPLLVWAIAAVLHTIGTPAPVLVGVVLVLLAPCIDYVVVFTRLAGGATARVLAATPLLLAAQAVTLPVLLPAIAGTSLTDAAEAPWPPLLRALLLLVVAPFLCAAVIQLYTRENSRAPGPVRRIAGTLDHLGTGAMVPLMMLVLGCTVAGHVAAVGSALGALVPAVLAFLVFSLVIVVLVGAFGGRLLGGTPERANHPGTGFSTDPAAQVAAHRGLVLTGLTRNSLVVLPVALALGTSGAAGPDSSLIPITVVTQTLVELVVLVVLVRLLPRVIPHR